MKFNLSLKNKELNLEADIESVLEKNIELKKELPDMKNRYQIKQEEKRRNKEFKNNVPKKSRYQIRQEEKRKTLELKQSIESTRIALLRQDEEDKQEKQRKYDEMKLLEQIKLEELRHKQNMQKKVMIICAIALFVIISLAASSLGMV